MGDASVLERLVADVTRQVRLRRAEFYGARGLLAGAIAGSMPLVFRETLGDLGYVLAAGLLLAGGVAGALYGFLLSVPVADAARIADRGYGLQDRVSTALEWGDRTDAGGLAGALVADAARRAEDVPRRRVVARRLPRSAKFIPVPLALGLALALAPPIPLPQGGLPNFSASTSDEDDEKDERVGKLEMDDRPKAAKRDPVTQRSEVQERTLTPRPGGGAPSQPGDLSALFKDTSLGGRAPDFNSFLKQGDERLKMLEQVDRLPDLAQDFTQRQSKMVFQKAKALQGGLNPGQFSPEKMRELLNEMERLGRRGGGSGGESGWGGDISEGMEALDQGQHDRAMQAMERALSRLRSMEDGGRDGKGLRGGREEAERRGAGRGQDRGAGQGGGMGDEGDFPEGEGSLPGRGTSPSAKGDATERLRGNPFDVGVEGEMRSGKKEGMDTNLVGKGVNMPSRLQYLGVIGQYRKMMEEAIAREQVPREYQEQVKGYFQSLDEK
jgi:hypothetical protein